MSLATRSFAPLPGLKGGFAILAVWVVLAAGAGVLAPYEPAAKDMLRLLQPPSSIHWLGSDQNGRDVLSLIVHGARTDLALCVLGVVPPFVIGCLIGLVAGMAGGLIGGVIERIAEVIEAFPRVVLVLAVMAALGADVRSFFAALALVGWPAYARLTRREWRRVKKAPFVAAARGLGFGFLRLHLLHILPNTLTPAIARALADVARVLMLTLSLGYFGFGIPPTPEWGSLVAQGQALLPSAWWVSLFPGLAALSLTLGLSWLADGLAARLGERG